MINLLNIPKYLYKLFIQNDEYSRYQLAEIITNYIYPKYKFSEYGRSFLNDTEFMKYYDIHVGNNVHSYDRKYFLFQILKLTKHLGGDIAECGVYKGASALLMFEQIKNGNKKMHLFDSFDGLSVPNIEDGSYWTKGDLRIPEQVARNKLPQSERIIYYKGWIPDKFNSINNIKFSFVHIDVDLYQPTYDSIKYFYTKMVRGGIILCDDYGFDSCPGAKKAFDQLLRNKEQIINVPTGQAFIIKI